MAMRALILQSLQAFKAFSVTQKIGVLLIASLAAMSTALRVANRFPTDLIEASSPFASPKASQASAPDCRKSVWPNYLRADLLGPARMLLSETKGVTLRIALDPAFAAMCAGAKLPQAIVMRAHAALASPAFDVAPSPTDIERKSPDNLQWEWLVRPKAAGAHALMLTLQGDDGLRLDMTQLLHASHESALVTSEGVAMIQVRVDTEIGLSPWQEAVLKIVSTVAGGLLAFVSFAFGSGALVKWWEARNAATPGGTP